MLSPNENQFFKPTAHRPMVTFPITTAMAAALHSCTNRQEEIAAVRACLLRDKWRLYLSSIQPEGEPVSCFISYNRWDHQERRKFENVINDLSTYPCLVVKDIRCEVGRDMHRIADEVADEITKKTKKLVCFRSAVTTEQNLMSMEDSWIFHSRADRVIVPVDGMDPQTLPLYFRSAENLLPYQSDVNGECYIQFFTSLLVGLKVISPERQATMLSKSEEMREEINSSITDDMICASIKQDRDELIAERNAILMEALAARRQQIRR